MSKFFNHIAPEHLIEEDFELLKSSENLDTTPEISDLIFMQSLEGRSHNGSGVFYKRTFVNTTVEDIVKALKRDPVKVKEARQSLINDIVAFVNDTLSGNKCERLLNGQGEPFLGIAMFRDMKVNARDVLRGLYIGGLRDNVDIRKETEKLYKVTIGCGECHLVDTKVMVRLGLDGESLAHNPHEDKMESYRREGLIVPSDSERADDPEVRYYYIRHRVGPGQSDDAAIVTAGILYNIDVALGVFLADAIDTLEKFAPQYHDQDQEIAHQIGRGFKELKVSLEDVYEIAYLASIPVAEEELVPDSSLRYLLAIDKRSGLTALQCHLDFIEGRKIIPMPISFKRILTTQFYEYVRRRLVNTKHLDGLSVPELTLRHLNRPLEEIIKKNYIVVSKETPLVDVVAKFKQTKSEIIIVTDKNQKIVGTLSATDLIDLANDKL